MTTPISTEPSLAARERVAVPSPAADDRITPARRFALIASTHALIDVFPIFFPALMLIFRENLGLTSAQVTIIYMLTPIFSGALQPVFAWISDKYDTRICGPVGLLLGGLAISSIGFARTFEQLITLQIIGVIGTGMFHPVGIALAGQSGTRFLRRGRAQAIGLFIAAGMVGQTFGPKIATSVTNSSSLGMKYLGWLAIPTVIGAVMLFILTRRMPHRHENHKAMRAMFDRHESRQRWCAIGVITAQNALRFIANIGMFVMFNVWADAHTRIALAGKTSAQMAEAASGISSTLQSAMTVGMGICVLSSGTLVARGRERRPLWLFSLIGAVAMAAAGFVGDWGVSQWGLGIAGVLPIALCVLLTPVGFFATFPIATSLGQRLQPGHTSLVSALFMGVGWSISSTAPLLAWVFFGGVHPDDAAMLSPMRINLGFVGFASLLVLAGLLTVFISPRLVERAAQEH